MLAYWDDTLACLLAFCAMLGTLKFFKILESNRSIKILSRAFRIGFVNTVSFTILLSVLTFAWLQFAFVIFNERIHGFSTFLKTMMSGFLLILGKFQLGDMLEANVVWTVVFYLTFNIFILFVMFQLFLSIIVDALGEAKKDE